MDDKRFRLYGSVIVMLFLFAMVRAATLTNPIYSTIEPAVVWLDERTQFFEPIGSDEAMPSDSLQAQNERLSAENEALRDQLSLPSASTGINAEVARRDLLGFRKNVTINVGSESGVDRGQTVLTEGNLFGVIEEVYTNTSIVRIVLDPEFRATVEASNERGVLKVQHGSVVVDLLPSKTLSGASVRTDGLDAQVVSNVPVGLLENQVASQASIFGTYNVLLPYNPYEVQFVEILSDMEGQ